MSKHVKGLLKGAKFNRSHSTLTPMAQEVVWDIKKLGSVSKIRPGIILNGKGANPRVDVKLVSRAVLVRVRSSVSIQEIYCYGPNLEKARLDIEATLRGGKI